MTEMLFNDADIDRGRAPVMLLAHGAGAGFDTPFMERLAGGLATHGVNVVRFEFPYMQRRRDDGRKRPPDRQPVLLDHFATMVRQCRDRIGKDRALVVGGKSMGGRMASLLVASPGGMNIQGAACFGYPFHPPGRLDRWRTGHFTDLRVPTVIFQGTRDPFGKPAELDGQPPLPSQVQVHWLEGGDHDFRPLKKQGLEPDALIDESARLAASFMHTLSPESALL